MPQPTHISRLPVPDVETLDADLQKYFRKCQEKLGLVPNVLDKTGGKALGFEQDAYKDIQFDIQLTALVNGVDWPSDRRTTCPAVPVVKRIS